MSNESPKPVQREPETAGQQLAKRAQQAGDAVEKAGNRAGTAAKKASEESKRAAARQAAAMAASIQADAFLDRRKKSRNKQVAENAAKAAEVTPPLGHSLRTMEPTTVGRMAAASMEPDWGDNPAHLSNPMEVKEDLRDDGLDPMDVDTREEATFGHFLVHAMADDADRGGRTPQQLEAEHDMVVAAMREHGVDHHSPLDLAGIEGGDAVGDPFGVGIDLSLGGGLGFGFGGED